MRSNSKSSPAVCSGQAGPILDNPISFIVISLCILCGVCPGVDRVNWTPFRFEEPAAAQRRSPGKSALRLYDVKFAPAEWSGAARPVQPAWSIHPRLQRGVRKTASVLAEVTGESMRNLDHVDDVIDSVMTPHTEDHQGAIECPPDELRRWYSKEIKRKLKRAYGWTSVHLAHCFECILQGAPRNPSVRHDAIGGELWQVELRDQIRASHGTKSGKRGINPDCLRRVHPWNQFGPLICTSVAKMGSILQFR